MSDEIRDRVKGLLRTNEESLDGVNEYVANLERVVLLLAGEIDSIKDDMEWHGVIEGHHRSQAQ